MKKLLVTGGNGHLGFNLVATLKRRGHHPVATVRDLKDPLKTRMLDELGAEIRQADLLDPSSLARAFKGVDGIFHTAAPNIVWASDPRRAIVDPILKGTQNVLEAAQAEGVKKIVFTSSCSAIGMDAPAERPLTENTWNDSATSPLIASKIAAERWGWEFCGEKGLRFVTICMPSMIGPGFQRHTPATLMYEKALQGRLPPLPELGFHILDARDAALAHVLAFEKPEATGRYIAAADYFDSKSLIQTLRKIEPGIKPPLFRLPRWMLAAVCGLDWAHHKFTGKGRQVTWELMSEFVSKHQHVSSSRIKNELGWEPRDSEQTFRDTFDWIRRLNADGKRRDDR